MLIVDLSLYGWWQTVIDRNYAVEGFGEAPDIL
jgi:hypothetical protein